MDDDGARELQLLLTLCFSDCVRDSRRDLKSTRSGERTPKTARSDSDYRSREKVAAVFRKILVNQGRALDEDPRSILGDLLWKTKLQISQSLDQWSPA